MHDAAQKRRKRSAAAGSASATLRGAAAAAVRRAAGSAFGRARTRSRRRRLGDLAELDRERLEAESDRDPVTRLARILRSVREDVGRLAKLIGDAVEGGAFAEARAERAGHF